MLAWFFKTTKVAPFECVEVFRKNPFLALYFSLFINDLSVSLPSFVCCFLYADNLTIWSSSFWFLLRWRLHEELYFDWSAGLSTGDFSIRASVRPLSSLWIPRKLTPCPTSSYSTPFSVSTPLQLSLGLFFKRVSSLKASFSLVSRSYTVSLLPHGALLRSPSLLYKAFLRPLLTYASPRWFSFS